MTSASKHTLRGTGSDARDLVFSHSGRFLLSFFFYLLKHSPVWILPLYAAGLINTVVDSGVDGLTGYLPETAGMVVLYLLNIPFNALHIRTFSRASREIEKTLRSSLIRKLQELSISWYARSRSGGLMSKILRDVESIELALRQVTMNLLPAVTSFIYVLWITLAREPVIALFFLASLPLMWLVRSVFALRLQSTNQKYRLDMENLSARMNQSIEMLPVARAHALEDTEIEQLETYFERISRSGLVLDVVNAVFGAGTWVVLQIFTLASLVFSAWMALRGRIPIGDIVLYQGFFQMISSALSSVFTVLPAIYRGRESYRSVREILDAPDLEENRGKPVFPAVEGGFRFDGVRYTYPGAVSPALDVPHLDIRPGQSVGIVGASGGGKTTFVNTLIGFLRPQEGELYLDGRPCSGHDMRSLRRFCSVVGQTPILFSGTIAANISYGDPRAKDEDIVAALKAANAWEFVEEMGINALVGEHGATLSGGQRQRLVLARAFYRNPRIMIFDEATSALDTAGEAQVQAALENIMKNRTTFIVAHRLSTVRNVERILVFEKGRIVEDGEPVELLSWSAQNLAGNLKQNHQPDTD